MKLCIVFFSVLFSFSSYGEHPLAFHKRAERVKQRNLEKTETKLQLIDRQERLQKNMQSLLFTLSHEDTSEEQVKRIVEIISKSALLNNDYEKALEEVFSRGRDCKNAEEKEGCHIMDIKSLIASEELIRLDTEALIQDSQEDWDLIRNGLLIITGAGLFFIPVAGPAISTAFFTFRIAVG